MCRLNATENQCRSTTSNRTARPGSAVPAHPKRRMRPADVGQQPTTPRLPAGPCPHPGLDADGNPRHLWRIRSRFRRQLALARQLHMARANAAPCALQGSNSMEQNARKAPCLPPARLTHVLCLGELFATLRDIAAPPFPSSTDLRIHATRILHRQLSAVSGFSRVEHALTPDRVIARQPDAAPTPIDSTPIYGAPCCSSPHGKPLMHKQAHIDMPQVFVGRRVAPQH